MNVRRFAHGNLGYYYGSMGDYFDAIDQLKRSIEISDTLPAVRYSLAASYWNLPDRRAHFPEEIENLERSLELDPNFVRSDELLGDIYDDLGDKDKAKYYHEHAGGINIQRK